MRCAVLSLCVASIASVALGSEFYFLTKADAYQGSKFDQTVLTLAEWQANNTKISQTTVADGHPMDHPTSNSRARLDFDQTQPGDATLRMFTRSGRGFSEVFEPIGMGALASIRLKFDLIVENLSGEHLNIAIGNKLHGVIANLGNGSAQIYESTAIGWFGHHDGQVHFGSYGDPDEFGIFQGTTKFGLVDDEYFSIVEGWEFNSFYFYGSRLFAPGESATTLVDHLFNISVSMFYLYDLSIVDMLNTGNFKVLAFDQFGNDRTADIRVGIVPEPGTFIAMGLGLTALLRRRRNR